MIRIAVFSDSHGQFEHAAPLIAKIGPAQWLLHAGDHIQDAGQLAAWMGIGAAQVRAVVGNCDGPVREPAEDLLEIGGVRMWIVHGHRYGVKEGLQHMYDRAYRLGAAVAIFGHSHVPVLRDEGGILLFNPGSITAPRSPAKAPSCGVLEVDEGRVLARHLFVT